MSEVKLTQLDAKDIPRYTYDEAYNANRVVIVGNISPRGVEALNPNNLPGGINIIETTKLITEYIEVPTIIKELEVKVLEIPFIVYDTKIVEVEKIIHTVEYKEIEKSVIVTEYKEVRVPVIVKEQEIVYIDRINFKMLMIMQGITLALILFSRFIKL